MRRSRLYGLLVVALLAVAIGVLFGEGRAIRVDVAHESIGIVATKAAKFSDGPTTTTLPATTTTSDIGLEPDVDAHGGPVEDHLGTTTTAEADLHAAAQPPGSVGTGTTQPTADSATTTAPPPPSTTVSQGGSSGEMESQFAGLINSYRSNNGLAALTRDGSLDARARSWSEKMAANQGLSHSDLGSLLGSWSSAAENVGMGGSVGSVFDALAGSSGHRSNMLGAYTHYGVGVWVDPNGVIWTTHVFTG